MRQAQLRLQRGHRVSAALREQNTRISAALECERNHVMRLEDLRMHAQSRETAQTNRENQPLGLELHRLSSRELSLIATIELKVFPSTHALDLDLWHNLFLLSPREQALCRRRNFTCIHIFLPLHPCK